ncbi:hypothetical protein [Streptomyces avermitilis]|uniref:hypothetical protein n=1 Tax=Streptomyces avermitilis TaxID=33903 RepID=UPI003806EFAA
MDSELAALAASGATTLVSLMVTDSWTHARELLHRFLSHRDPDNPTITDMDALRARLLAPQPTGHPYGARDTIEELDAYLRHLLEARVFSGADLRTLLTSLQRIQSEAAPSIAVRNNINGGVQHGPVIQAGQVTGLTLHNPAPAHHRAEP